MAFPTIVSSTTSNQTSDSTSHTFNLPGTLITGNLALLFVCTDGVITITWPGTWTEIAQGSSSYITIGLAYRFIDGTEGSTDTFTTSTSQTSAHQCYMINSHRKEDLSIINHSPGATGLTTTPDPDNVNMTVVTDNLYFAISGVDGGDTFSAAPSGYSGLTHVSSGSGAGHCGLAMAYRTARSSSEDPGTFTKSASNAWLALTYGIRGFRGFPIGTLGVGSY